MSAELVRNQLLDAGLHEESVKNLINHYQDMRFHLSNENYIEAGTHVGNFCENLANIILAETGEGIDPRIQVGSFIDKILNGHYEKDGLDYEIYTMIPRAMRIAYDLRSNRDSVHVNLEVEVNYSDTQTAVRLCTWMLSELVRVYGDDEHLDDIAELIEDFAAPLTPYIDNYKGKRIVMNRGLDLEEEIIIHLHSEGKEVAAEQLVEWIPDENGHKIKSKLGNLKQARKVHYEDGMAKITPLGVEDAEDIIDEKFGGKIPDIRN